jgi:Bacterial PH domain
MLRSRAGWHAGSVELRKGWTAEDGTPGPAQWRRSPALPALKFAGAAVFLLLGAVFGDETVRLVLALAAAAGLAAWGVRDLVAPVRVAADADAVTVVVGYAGRRRLPWAQVENVRVDTRARRCTSSARTTWAPRRRRSPRT